MSRLADKVVVIAGGATGIGAATAARLGNEGACVVVGDINGVGAESTATAVREQGGRASATAFDLADEQSVAALFQHAKATFGRLDGLFNVGADLSPQTIGRDSNIVDVPMEVWRRTLDVNLTGYMLTIRHALPLLLESGGGAIVNTVSGLVLRGDRDHPSYGAAKGGLIPLALHVASRWGKQGIRCNTLAPGVVLTENQLQTITDEQRSKIMEALPSTRFGRPADIAAMAALLLSDEGEWINGQLIAVNGGGAFH